MHLLCPNSSTYKSVKKLWRQHCLRFAMEHPTLDSTWTVKKSMTTLLKLRDEQNSTKKATWTRTSVKWWTLVTCKSMRHKFQGLMRLKIPFVVPWCHQLMSKSMEKTLVKSLKNNCYLWGSMEGVSLDDGQTSLYSPEKAKASFAKAKAEFKNKEFNSQFIWTTLLSGQQYGPTSSPPSICGKSACLRTMSLWPSIRYRMMISKYHPLQGYSGWVRDYDISGGG